jgi:hypothetical protein
VEETLSDNHIQQFVSLKDYHAAYQWISAAWWMDFACLHVWPVDKEDLRLCPTDILQKKWNHKISPKYVKDILDFSRECRIIPISERDEWIGR